MKSLRSGQSSSGRGRLTTQIPHSWRNEAVAASLVLGVLACGRSSPPSTATDSPAPTPPAEIAAAVTAFLASPTNGVANPSDRDGLTRIYASSSPLWVDERFRPRPSAREALATLSDAAAEGLLPADYRAELLSSQAKVFEGGVAVPGPSEVAAFDVTLTYEMMRYLRQFHRGRVSPKDLGFQMSLPSDEHDYAALARDIAVQSRLKETLASVMPPLVQYRALRSMLPRYRALALVDGVTLPRLPPPPKGSVKPGGTAPGLDILRTRLIALGDLPEKAAPLSSPELYEGEIVDGVKRFQTRHGYEADGILGPATWAALNVPLSWRLRQIELAMERMRWLPHLGERAFVAVNIPMFHLWAWDRVPETGEPDFGMGVIVGKALDTKTPVFLEEMQYLIFQPYWNVPKSILQKEILPILRRDLGYLDRQDMEMVDGPSDDASPVAATSSHLDRLAEGKLRLRQRSGPKNALGQVKFMFPNDENVYLHSTPAPELFGRARRDFSHGCVRVEDPVALALWALKDQPEWTREKIVAAMSGKASFRVNLTRPIRVVMYYVTATVIPEERAVHFAGDIYGHDPGLDKALLARARPSLPPR